MKEARTRLGYTQAQVAERIGVTVGCYYGLENYRQKPDICKGLAIARLLGRDPYELFDCTKYKPRKSRPEIPEPFTADRRNELLASIRRRQAERPG